MKTFMPFCAMSMEKHIKFEVLDVTGALGAVNRKNHSRTEAIFSFEVCHILVLDVEGHLRSQ